jgi:excinuclease ABC subunit B
MYASRVTKSMAHAMGETERRREKQLAYNEEHGIDPTPLRKKIADITSILAREKADTDELISNAPARAGEGFSRAEMIKSGPDELSGLIQTLTEQMMQASGELKFELAAKICTGIGRGAGRHESHGHGPCIGRCSGLFFSTEKASPRAE